MKVADSLLVNFSPEQIKAVIDHVFARPFKTDKCEWVDSVGSTMGAIAGTFNSHMQAIKRPAGATNNPTCDGCGERKMLPWGDESGKRYCNDCWSKMVKEG
jgi:hypothetical protein